MSLRDTCADSPVRRVLIRLAAGVPFGIYELKSQIGSGKVADWLLFQLLPCPLATVPVSLSPCGVLIEMKPNFVVNLCCRLTASLTALPADHCQIVGKWHRVITECICDGSNTVGFVVIGPKFRDPQHFSLWYGDMVVFRGVDSARYRREQTVHAWVFLRCSLMAFYTHGHTFTCGLHPLCVHISRAR